MEKKNWVKVRYEGEGWYYVEWNEGDLIYSVYQKTNNKDNSIYVNVPAYKNVIEKHQDHMANFAGFYKGEEEWRMTNGERLYGYLTQLLSF